MSLSINPGISKIAHHLAALTPVATLVMVAKWLSAWARSQGAPIKGTLLNFC